MKYKSEENIGHLYMNLGEIYKAININQAYLCFENAIFFFNKMENIQKDIIEKCKAELQKIIKYPEFMVRKMDIIILSYNNWQLTRDCIESIRKYNDSSTYDIVVVDNGSTDNSIPWLEKQKDIKLIKNMQNLGFPYACNQGVEAASKNSDILFLNNDTLIPLNALFWLRMGLYENIKIGAVGSVSNNVVNYQQVPECFHTIKEWMTFAEQNNVPIKNPYEKKGWLVGFCMLLKRAALDKIYEDENQIFDTRFSPGNYEDNDLSIRLLKKGFQLLLCKNSFVYHYGATAFGKDMHVYYDLLRKNQKKLEEKYGIDMIPYYYVESDLINLIQPKENTFSVLEIGCRLGATLTRIESIWESVKVVGIERNPKLADLASMITTVIREDFLKTNLELDTGYDYIILDKILSFNKESEQILYKVKKYLNRNGKILVVMRNRQYNGQEVIYGKNIKNACTLDEIVKLFNKCNLKIGRFEYKRPTVKIRKNMSQKKEKVEQLLEEIDKFVFEAE